MRKFRFAVGAVAAAGLLLSGSIAGADPGPATHVDSLASTIGANTINVSGGATFVSVPSLLGEDSTGDSLGSGAGTDLSTVTYSRTAPNGKINFTLGIADQPAATGGVPEAVAYYIDITVNTDGTDSFYMLWAARSAQNAALGGTTPVFRRYICTLNATTGARDCTSATTLTGRMTAGVVEWQAALSNINAQPGSVITATDIVVVPTVSGAVWGVLLLDSASQDEEYRVPGATVKLGIAPASTAVDSVELGTPATVNQTSGAFSGQLVKPITPGSYVVVAQACFGDNSCGARSSTTITI